MALAVVRMEKGGDPPTFAQLQAWKGLVEDARHIAAQVETSAEVAIPVPPRNSRPVPVGFRPRLVSDRGNVQ